MVELTEQEARQLRDYVTELQTAIRGLAGADIFDDYVEPVKGDLVNSALSKLIS